MNRAYYMCGVLLLGATGALRGQNQDKTASQPPPPPPPPTKSLPAKPIPKLTPAPKGGNPKAPARVVNPGNPATRLFTATPEERDLALEKMTPQQQDNARQLWKWYDGLPKEQQTIQLRRLDRFMQLTPAQRNEVKALIAEVQELQPDRRQMVGQALLHVQTLPDNLRGQFLNGQPFKDRFTSDEQRIITRLADAWLPPF